MQAQLRPDDPEPCSSIGLIYWPKTFRASGEMRDRHNPRNVARQVRDMDPLPARVLEQDRISRGPVIGK
jgi:hypothetical protein